MHLCLIVRREILMIVRKKLMDFKQMLKIPRGKDRQDFFYSICHALCYAETKTTKPYKNVDELRKELPDGFFNK